MHTPMTLPPIMKTACWTGRSRGFTLIELMVTVVVVTILASIAVPSYRDYLIRGKIPDATSTLATKRVQMEQYYQDNRTYVGAAPCTADNATSQNFNFSAACGATTYTLTATGKSSITGISFTIDQDNAKTTSLTAGSAMANAGWSAHSPNNCWVTNKGGAC